MNKKMLKEKIFAAAGSLLYEKGFVSSVDLMMRLDRLSLRDYEAWRRRQVPYLEKVLVGSLGKLSTIMYHLRAFAREKNLRSSYTAYMSWGKKIILRFSKYGNPKVEAGYSTHYVQPKEQKRSQRPSHTLELRDANVSNSLNTRRRNADV